MPAAGRVGTSPVSRPWATSRAGIDLNPNFVAMATAHAQTSCADLRKVGSIFPVGHFDGVWSSASLVHLNEADAKDVLRQFFVLLRPGGKLYACVNTVGRTGWLDEPDGRRWYCIWKPDAFAQAVASVGFGVDQVRRGAVRRSLGNSRRAGGMRSRSSGDWPGAASADGLNLSAHLSPHADQVVGAEEKSEAEQRRDDQHDYPNCLVRTGPVEGDSRTTSRIDDRPDRNDEAEDRNEEDHEHVRSEHRSEDHDDSIRFVAMVDNRISTAPKR